MTKAKQATKNAAKAVGSGIAGGITGSIKAVWTYGGKYLLIASFIISLLVFGMYNPVFPEATVYGVMSAGIAELGFGAFISTPVGAGFGLLGFVILCSLGYVTSQLRKLGKLGMVAIFGIAAGFSFWLFTMGTFDGMATDFIVLIGQAIAIAVLAFGQVFAKIDRILSGSGNVDVVTDTSDEMA